jgi:hypothetical protein
LSTLLAKVSKNINNAYEGGEIDTTQNVISHTVSATVASVE